MRELFIVCENWNVEEEEGIFDGIVSLGGDKRGRPIRNGWEKEREEEKWVDMVVIVMIKRRWPVVVWVWVSLWLVDATLYYLNINTSSNDCTLYTASFMQEKGYFKNEGLKGGAFNF